jgi:AraC-like DNA-binding protein
MVVEEILKREAIAFQSVHIGEIHLAGGEGGLTVDQKNRLKTALEKVGFGMIDTRTEGLIEKIRQMVMKRARSQGEGETGKSKLSDYLARGLHHEYSYLSSLFSSVEGRTIERYFIEQRIEYVKELLIYDEKTLSEIAMDLEYSSTAHLSAQFKKVTGLTPSYFKKLGAARRKSIDSI